MSILNTNFWALKFSMSIWNLLYGKKITLCSRVYISFSKKATWLYKMKFRWEVVVYKWMHIYGRGETWCKYPQLPYLSTRIPIHQFSSICLHASLYLLLQLRQSLTCSTLEVLFPLNILPQDAMCR